MSTADIAQRVRDARDARSPLRIRGAGTWLDAGRPVQASGTLSVAEDRGIVEYVPGDLTMTARAGSSLHELDRAARKNGQWLSLAPWGGGDATLGATIATATAGPYAAAFGLPRDVVLGMEFVTGAGDVVRSGGRVVKNVAGFDLTRLLTGSWGTLGIVTEASVRLRALPPRSRTVLVSLDDARPSDLSEPVSRLRALPFAPFASELLNAGMARLLGVGERATLLVELGGNATAIDAQLDLIRALGPTQEAPEGLIERLRSADGGMPATWRMSGRPTRFPELWCTANASGVMLHGNPVRGVIRALSRHATLPASGAHSGTVIVERLPAEAWRASVAPAPDPLAAAVRAKFDPAGVLNPGILGAAA